MLWLMLVLFASQCAADCVLSDYSDNVKTCSSLADFYLSSDHPYTWTHVIIKNQEKITIDERILMISPNVHTFTFSRSVNAIEPFAFAAKSNLEYIKFSYCYLPVLRRNWFSFNSDRNISIEIENSNVRSLEPNCFQDSGNLYFFNMSGNSIFRINANVFTGTSFTFVYFNNNGIELIEDGAFADMPNLQELDLHRNLLTSLNAKSILNNVPNLSKLEVGSNNLTSLTENDFVSFKKLRRLDLSDNQLAWLEDGAFNGLHNLEYLNVERNKLSSFPETTLPYDGLPFLEQLDLADNRLTSLPRSFLRYFPILRKISIFGNPWQCTCYRHILNAVAYQNVSVRCVNEYFGKRPVCVVPLTGGDKCVEHIQNASELYDTYIESLSEYDSDIFCLDDLS